MDVLFRERQRTLASSFEQGVGQGLFARLHPLDGSLDGIFGDQAMHEYRLVLADPCGPWTTGMANQQKNNPLLAFDDETSLDLFPISTGLSA